MLVWLCTQIWNMNLNKCTYCTYYVHNRKCTTLNYMNWHVFSHVTQSYLISWYLNKMPWNTAHYTYVYYNFCNHILSHFFSYHNALYINFKSIWVVPICREYGVCPKHPVLHDHAFYFCSVQSGAWPFSPQIQHVISCFQTNVFIMCPVENFKGIYMAHIHNKVKENLPVFFWMVCREDS